MFTVRWGTRSILNGASSGTFLSITQRKFELVINVKAANAIGLTIPPSLLVSAQRRFGSAHRMRGKFAWVALALFDPEPKYISLTWRVESRPTNRTSTLKFCRRVNLE